MTSAEDMARFTSQVSFTDMDAETVTALKKRVLDSVGIAIGAMDADPVNHVWETVTDIGGNDACTLWGAEQKVSPPQAAMYNTALVRYLDFMDSFLAPGETPHPSDNIAAIISCGEYVDATGEDVIEAVGVAYEIQAALAWNAPVRDRGWDHVTHTIFSCTAGCGKILGLSEDELVNAIGIAGTAHNALRVTRTGTIGMWKGFASANTARNAVYSCMLAGNGMHGPNDVFNGEKGWKHIVSGAFDCDYDPGCDAVHKTMAKKYVAETYAQSAVHGIIQLVEENQIDPATIQEIHLETFHGAYQIIGGGEGGDRYEVEEKEQADHSLPYMLAVAALDGTVMNEQYETKRIQQEDAQTLLRKVTVEENQELTKRFEQGEMPAILTVDTGDDTYTIEKEAFPGHPTNPMTWEQVEDKFHSVASAWPEQRRERIVDTVEALEQQDAAALVDTLRK